MLHRLVLTGSILAATAVALPAQAQLATYCAGALQAESFPKQVTPGVRATYSVVLRNPSGQARTFVIVVTAGFTDRPLPTPRSLRPGATTTVVLGAQTLIGRAPMRDNELAEVVRITCS